MHSSIRTRGRKPIFKGMALKLGAFKDGDITIRKAIFRRLIKFMTEDKMQKTQIDGRTFQETFINKLNDKNGGWNSIFQKVLILSKKKRKNESKKT